MNRKISFVIALLMPVILQIHAHGKTVWGVSAAHLGEPYSGAVSFEDLLENRRILSIKDFYRIGGENVPATPTECKMLYTADTLFVLFRCRESNLSFPAISHHEDWFSLSGSPVEQDASFPDKTDFFLMPSMASSSYYQFTVTLDGRRFGSKFNAPQTLQDADGSVPQRRHEKIDDFDGMTVKRENEWIAFLKIPWETIGGKPASPFGFIPVRTHWRNSEVSSPVAMDYSDRPAATDLFIETHFGSASKTHVYGQALCRLPSGRLRWQRPAQIFYPDEKTKYGIRKLQQSTGDATTEKNLPDRLALIQSWVSLMELEGFNFGSTRGSLPLEDMYAYRVRRNVNRELQQNNVTGACKSIDTYLIKLDSVSGIWFADGSPGNIHTEAWTPLTEIESVQSDGQVSALRCRAGDRYVNLYLSLPATGGVRLHSGREGFFTPDSLHPLQFREGGKPGVYTCKENALEIVITRKPFGISFLDSGGRLKLKITGIAFRLSAEGAVEATDFRTAVTPGEAIFGFGEKFNTFNQNGTVLTLWGMDDWLGLTTGLQNQSYKPIPVYHSTEGYMVFVNSSCRLRADIGKSVPGQLRLSQHGAIFDYYFWIDAPEQALQSYTRLTGKPVLPPKWAFEPWMGRTGRGWRATPLDPVEEKKRVIRRFEELDIPHSAIYAEGVGAERPDLHTFATAHNIKVLSWYYSAVDEETQRKLMPTADSASLPVLRINNPLKLASRDISYIDFTHPNAGELSKRWWKRRLDLGVAGSMIDFGDRVPEDAVFHNGKKGDGMHNFYAYDYHRVYAEVFAERRGADFILFGRSAAPGTQRWVAQFAGDLRGNFRGLEGGLNGLLNLSACGFSTWGSDLGGFRAWPDPAVYIRWTQFACFSPLMRSHGRVPSEPWEYGDRAVSNYKQYVWVRENLLDYIYNSAVESSKSGLPMVRALPLVFPGEADSVSDQYMFGKALMVCPVITEDNKRTVTFPAGKWTNLWNGTVTVGSRTVETAAPPDVIPVYMREGTVLPVSLHPCLRFGSSMSLERVDAILVTLPGNGREISYTDYRKVGVEVRQTSALLTVSLTNAPDILYLIIYDEQISAVRVDGDPLPQLKETELETLPPGWYREPEQGRTVIRLPRGLSKTIECL
ncbi:MAG: hypothetical protein LBL07_20530 [Tannerella sp.]|jgi:alpha-glucosidase (family GH31 glycosyl hydrolase)|nr:hypothetical protein [Tannerella sp.]